MDFFNKTNDKQGYTCQFVSVEALDQSSKEQNLGKYILIPLQKQIGKDKKYIPLIYEKDCCTFINCAAFTSAVQMTFALVSPKNDKAKISIKEEKRGKEGNGNNRNVFNIYLEFSEYDKEVELISGKKASNTPPNEPVKNVDTNLRRDYDTLPRYYKEAWSPDRKQITINPNNKDSKPQVQPGNLKAQGDALQLSPIQKTGGLENSQYETEEEPLRIFRTQYSKITFRGLTSNQIPPASSAIPLLNIRSLLDSAKLFDWVTEVDYLTALALISGKRFVQASEILRKIEGQLLSLVEGGTIFQSPRSNTPIQKNPSQKLLIKAAKLEILIADCMNQHFQLFEKLHSLKRACGLSLGTKVEPVSLAAPTKYCEEDICTALNRLHPHLTRLLLSMMNDPNESQRAATIKCLDFLLEQMGCSLGVSIVHILKVILATYPSNTTSPFALDSFNCSLLSTTSALGRIDSPRKEDHKLRMHEEPLVQTITSLENMIIVGEQFSNKHMNLYNHLLSTYMNVLSSISSPILHKVFFEIIMPHCFAPEISVELRCILVKIADKIITICQGDLILSPAFLTSVLNEQTSTSEQLATSVQSLWQTIRTKVCPNCSLKSKKQFISWLFEGIVGLAEQIAEQTEAEEELLPKLRTYIDIIAIMTVENSQEEEANSLVLQNKNEDKFPYYVLLNPLLYWLNYSMSVEGRIELFKEIWPIISRLLNNMKDNINFEVTPIYHSLIGKVNDHCKNSSPTLPMLQFLHIILSNVKNVDLDLKVFLVELTDRISSHIPNYPYDDIFIVFEMLLNLVFPNLSEKAFKNILLSITDKYTLRSKRQKQSLENFISKILSNSIEQIRGKAELCDKSKTFFEITTQICIIENADVSNQPQKEKYKNKNAAIHEKFLEKLIFFLEVIKALGEHHRKLFSELLNKPGLESFLIKLTESGHSSIRLRAHEILETLCSCYIANVAKWRSLPLQSVDSLNTAGTLMTTNQSTSSILSGMDGNVIRKEQLLLGKLIVKIAKRSFEAAADSYMQFNALILLDLMFQSILPAPSFQAELQKKHPKSPKKQRSEVIDLEVADQVIIEYQTIDSSYLNMRMLIILKLWKYIQNALNSPWSNIRSITYGLICSMMKVTIEDYQQAYKSKLKQILLPLLLNLLGSKESESKAGGLNILGSLSGLSNDVSKNPNLGENLEFFRRNSVFISLPIWEKVFDLQEDWDSTIREAATVLIQLAAPRESVLHFHKIKKETQQLKMKCLSNTIGNYTKIAASQILLINNRTISSDLQGLMETLAIVRQTTDLEGNEECAAMEEKNNEAELNASNGPENENISVISDKEGEPESEYFFIEKYTDDQIKEIISIFRNDFKPPNNLWIEKNQADSDAGFENESEEIVMPNSNQQNSKPTANQLPIAEGTKKKFNMVDILEDKLVEHMPKPTPLHMEAITLPKIKPKSPNKTAPVINSKKEEIKRNSELKKRDSLDAEPFKFFNSDEEINQDDLEIIDLEDEDILKSLEEDKIPVLKNPSTKTNRPSAPKPGSNPNTVKIDLGLKPHIQDKKEDKPVEPLKLLEKKEAVEKIDPIIKEETKNVIAKEISKEPAEDDLAASLRLKKANNIKTIVVPSKEPIKINENLMLEEDIVKKEEDQFATNKIKSNQSYCSGAVKKKEESLPKGKLNKSFDYCHAIRIQSKNAGVSRAHITKQQSSSPSKAAAPATFVIPSKVGKRKAIHSTRDKIHDDCFEDFEDSNDDSHSNSLPMTPTGIKKPNNKLKLQTSFVSTMFKDLKLNPKKKGKHKRQPQQHLAQTSPALAVFFKNYNETTRKNAENTAAVSTERSEKPAKLIKQSKKSQRIVIQGKKMEGVKVVCESQGDKPQETFSTLN